jgi:hypothetical protein
MLNVVSSHRERDLKRISKMNIMSTRIGYNAWSQKMEATMQLDNIANELIGALESSGSIGKMLLEKLREIVMTPTEEELDAMYEEYIRSKSSSILESF